MSLAAVLLRDGRALRWAPAAMRADRAVVHAAVRSDGYALRWAAPAAAHMEDAAKGADGLAPARVATVSAPANHEDLVEATADDDHGACTPCAAPNALADADASAPPRGTARRTRVENILPSSPREVRAAVHSGPRLRNRSSRNLSCVCSSPFSFYDRCDFDNMNCPFRPAVILRW